MHPLASTASMPQMPAMSSTFSFATHVTLWFSGWTTISVITYLLALFLLFALGLFHRFLGALKFQLETKWKANPNVVEQRTSHKKTVAAAIGNPAKGWSHTLRQQPVPLRLAEPEGIETEPLSPTTLSEAEIAKSSPTPNMPFWVPSAPWSAKRDGITATLEFTRALIGYFLMLAVMTYNIGFLFAITGSVLLGELVFGRYARGSAGTAEDGCHS